MCFDAGILVSVAKAHPGEATWQPFNALSYKSTKAGSRVCIDFGETLWSKVHHESCLQHALFFTKHEHQTAVLQINAFDATEGVGRILIPRSDRLPMQAA